MRSLVIAYLFFAVAAVSQAGLESTIKPLGGFSSSEIVLELDTVDGKPAGDVPDVSAVYFRRMVNSDPMSPWEPLPGDCMVSATRAVVSATHGETYQFRSAAFLGERREMMTIADFETLPDFQKMTFLGIELGFWCEYGMDSARPAQGKSSMSFDFRYVFEEENPEFGDDWMIGFPMSTFIPTRDWSGYRYLELYLMSSLESPLEFLVNSGETSFRASVEKHTLHNDPSSGWLYLRYDLDEIFEKPEDRQHINTCAFIYDLDKVDLKKQYNVQFDAIRLWASNNFVETAVDATPPSVPQNFTHKFGMGTIEWSWDGAVDEESGIAGYSYSWSPDVRVSPDEEIEAVDSRIELSFAYPRSLVTYHLKIRAKNNAGVWSEDIDVPLEFNPSKGLPKLR